MILRICVFAFLLIEISSRKGAGGNKYLSRPFTLSWLTAHTAIREPAPRDHMQLESYSGWPRHGAVFYTERPAPLLKFFFFFCLRFSEVLQVALARCTRSEVARTGTGRTPLRPQYAHVAAHPSRKHHERSCASALRDQEKGHAGRGAFLIQLALRSGGLASFEISLAPPPIYPPTQG